MTCTEKQKPQCAGNEKTHPHDYLSSWFRGLKITKNVCAVNALFSSNKKIPSHTCNGGTEESRSSGSDSDEAGKSEKQDKLLVNLQNGIAQDKL